MEDTYSVKKIAEKLGIPEEDLLYYGRDKAKIDIHGYASGLKRKAKLILTTAITPTKAGEGKTTTAIGLADGLCHNGVNALVCLREPSLGPVFGVKGGGCGGGEATLYPEDDINLHFTGDIHALTSANNLLCALIENELYQNSPLDIDSDRIVLPHTMDMNERSLRNIQVCLGKGNGTPHASSFVITAASEIMAIFCLSKDEEDFLDRVDAITVAYDKKGNPIHARDLQCRGAIRKLMHTALFPNLVQTKHHTPALVHGGPFANIAHGCNSLIASDLALKLADYVVTEAGFGSDLGMEKFLDIVSPLGISIRLWSSWWRPSER
jgi:formate--tetrahydrofolate ligase